MTRFLVNVKDEPRPSPALAYESHASGADQLVARDPEVIAWLAKVYGEMARGSRPWSIFSKRGLKRFLTDCGVDLEAATKAHADAIEPPAQIADVGSCIGKLRGASFLALPEQEACLEIERARLRSPHRR